MEGERALGKMLGSPQKGAGGADIYKNMRAVKKGNIVIHLIDNTEICGVSVIKSECEETTGWKGTDWEGRPYYQVKLKNYIKLMEPLQRNEFLNEKFKRTLRDIANKSEVFYDKDLDLRQGAYLTPCHVDLANLLNQIYFEKHGVKLPHFDEILSTNLNIQDGPDSKNNITKVSRFPLNLILYGPPGTGKTYKTVDCALAIIEKNRTLEEIVGEEDIESEEKVPKRGSLLKRFKQYKDNQQIEFITFHQNYSYEDFIQGLRPNTENSGGNLSFDLKDGIFKRIADRALNNYKAYRQSKDRNQKPPFKKVFEKFIQPLLDDVEDELEVRMRKVSFYIADVTDSSIHFRKASGGTDHTLSLGSLAEMYEKGDIGDIQGLRSYYRPLLETLLNIAKSIEPETIKEDLKHYVIIIDEINRANISKVFGELITLIEPDKRYNKENEMVATLPSGQSFVVPSNLYIIGTMNTADKSIALLDIALRRRFVFKRINPEPKLVRPEYEDLFKRLNIAIISERGPDFQLGHSYFMENGNLADIMNNKVIPLLYEYFMNDGETVSKVLHSAGVNTIEVYGLYEFESYNA